jgi:hypothetical protein
MRTREIIRFVYMSTNDCLLTLLTGQRKIYPSQRQELIELMVSEAVTGDGTMLEKRKEPLVVILEMGGMPECCDRSARTTSVHIFKYCGAPPLCICT